MLWHVSEGSAIKGVLFDRLRDRWAGQTSSQGEVIRAAAGEAALLLGAVRRTRDAQLFTFLLRALTSQTPTSVRNYPEMTRDGLPLVCPLCGLPELARHPGFCPTSGAQSEEVAQRGGRLIAELCHWIGDSGAVSVGHAAALRAQERVNGYVAFARTYAGSLGLLPSGLAHDLLPGAALTGSEAAVKRVRRELPRRLLGVRLMILRGTMYVHNGWVIRRRTALGAQGGVAAGPGNACHDAGGGSPQGGQPGAGRGVRRRLLFETDTTQDARPCPGGRSRESPPRDGLEMRPTTNSVVHEHCPFFLRRRFFISADRRGFEGRRAVPESLSSAVRSVLMSTPFTRQRRTRARAHTRAQTQTRKHTSMQARYRHAYIGVTDNTCNQDRMGQHSEGEMQGPLLSPTLLTETRLTLRDLSADGVACGWAWRRGSGWWWHVCWVREGGRQCEWYSVLKSVRGLASGSARSP
jgi:hypothetical protein